MLGLRAGAFGNHATAEVLEWLTCHTPPQDSVAASGPASSQSGIAQATGFLEHKEWAELMGLGLHNGKRVNRGSERPRPFLKVRALCGDRRLNWSPPEVCDSVSTVVPSP